MKTNYKYISFYLIKEHPKTQEYECRNNNSQCQLGIIKYYPAWRQYCYFPTIQAVYSKGCFEDINNFIDQLEQKRKDKNG